MSSLPLPALAVDPADRINTVHGDASEAVGVKVHAYLAEIIQQAADEAQSPAAHQ